MWTELAEQIVELDQVDNLLDLRKRARSSVSGGDEGFFATGQISTVAVDCRFPLETGAIGGKMAAYVQGGGCELARRIDDEQDIDAGI